MSIGYHVRRLLLEHRLRRASRAADYARRRLLLLEHRLGKSSAEDYARSILRDAEAHVRHYDDEATRLRVALAQLEHRAELARMGGA